MPLFVIFRLKQDGFSGVVRRVCLNAIRLFNIRHDENRDKDKHIFQSLEGRLRLVRLNSLLILLDKRCRGGQHPFRGQLVAMYLSWRHLKQPPMSCKYTLLASVWATLSINVYWDSHVLGRSGVRTKGQSVAKVEYRLLLSFLCLQQGMQVVTALSFHFLRVVDWKNWLVMNSLQFLWMPCLKKYVMNCLYSVAPTPVHFVIVLWIA